MTSFDPDFFLPYDFIYMWNLKSKGTMEQTKSRNRPINTKKKLMVARGEQAGEQGEEEWEVCLPVMD